MTLLQEAKKATGTDSQQQPRNERFDRHNYPVDRSYSENQQQKQTRNGKRHVDPPVHTRLSILRRHFKLTVALIITAVLVGGAVWWLNARHFESTYGAFTGTFVEVLAGEDRVRQAVRRLSRARHVSRRL